MMKRVLSVGMLGVGLMTATAAWSAAKTYQVTGPVLALTADTITVQKGKDRWEIGRDAGTTMPADVKVGDKVTVEYRMTATTVAAKAAKAAKPAKHK
jgi:hypothetical protein